MTYTQAGAYFYRTLIRSTMPRLTTVYIVYTLFSDIS